MKIHAHKVLVAMFMAIMTTVASGSATGGLVWTQADAHFKNVDAMGQICLSDLWHRISLKSGWNLPIYGVFKSGYNGESSILGKHWRMPLFESTAIQLDERNYLVEMPDGRTLKFKQLKNQKDSFKASDVWRGEIKKSSFVVSSMYGVELTYNNGRLYRLKAPQKYGDYDLTFKYRKGRLVELKNKSNVIAKIDYKEGITVFDLANDRVEMSFSLLKDDEKFETELTIAKNRLPLKTYTQNANGSLIIATVGEDNTRLISWNVADGTVRSDGDYTYTIKPSPYKGGFAEISRTNAKGVKESWYKDNWNGKETTLRSDGVLIERSWFTTGKLRGLTKSVTTSRGGRFSDTREYSYDENRRLVRSVEGGKEHFLIYDQLGRLAVQVTDGKISHEFIPGMRHLAEQYLKK